MRIAALVKQIPQFETMTLGTDGRLVREGLPLEMNAYCRRAVAKAVELATERPASSVTVFTLGPPTADDVLREAIAWGTEHGIATIDAVHICDPAFAGSDTFATASAIAAALARYGPFDLVLCGRNSVDADTGQVGPQIAALLDLPFVSAARYLAIDDRPGSGSGSGSTVHARAELDDGWMQIETSLPAVISCAERLCEPSKVDPAGRAAVDAAAIRRLGADELGAGPWGAAASPTRVGASRTLEVTRRRALHPDAALREQVEAAVAVLRSRDALTRSMTTSPITPLPPPRPAAGPAVVALVEPDRPSFAAELLSEAAMLATTLGGHAVAAGPADTLGGDLGALGADRVVALDADTEEDLAAALCGWLATNPTSIVLAPSTAFGREVAARTAAAMAAGLTGDAVELDLDGGRLVAWKPAFGGAVVAAIRCTSDLQMATVRAGTLAAAQPRDHAAPVEWFGVGPRRRVVVLARTRDDDLDELADAAAVIGVGRGVDPAAYDDLEPLRARLGAAFAATRKVTDAGWMPRARQVGITGRSIAPRLYVSIGAGGKFNHSVGYRNAGTVLAINRDREAAVFATADAGIVGDWTEVVPLLVETLDRSRDDS